ncbi:MAG TPA: LegC family aminotransferase [Burkholderiales bacterium]|nr:LegC family aminotransferase [Burkholderiales bacterium]
MPEAVLQAVRRVVPARPQPVALHEPEFRGNEWRYLRECLDSGWVSSAGAYVDRFEQMLADTTQAKHAIVVVNGTAALHMCLLLAGVQRGDEVLVPTLTFIATANAISYVGAVPHFVDSEGRTLGVDVEKLEAHLQRIAEVQDGICRNKATGAVIRTLVPMHTFGHPADLDAIVSLCDKWCLRLVEDAAESLGSLYKDRHTGTYGLLSALSLIGNKLVTSGGGGAILTNDADLAARAKHLTTTARTPHRWSFLHDQIGYNYRLPNINAALGCAQLERLPDMLARKRRLSERYIQAFEGVDGARIAVEPAGTRSNYWLVALLLSRADLELRDTVLRVLNENGLQARPVWTLMHRLPMYQSCPRMDLAGAESLDARIVNLPSSPALAD